MNVATGVNVSLTGIGLMGGEACGDGGAILNNGSLVLDSVTVLANLGERGGAISNIGTLTVVDSVLVQNRSVLIDDDPYAETCNGNNRGTSERYSTTERERSHCATSPSMPTDPRPRLREPLL